MNARLDGLPVVPVVSGGLILGGLLGLLAWWLGALDDAIAAADFGVRKP